MSEAKLKCFKAYDIRGRVPEELNPDIAWRIGRAYGEYLAPAQVVVGCDIRLQSPELASAVCEGLLDSGVDVIDIGLCGTEEVYFQTFHRGTGGGIMVTASHNPMDYNGMKLVREGSRPISGDTGLDTIRDLAERGSFQKKELRGTCVKDGSKEWYIRHLLGYVDLGELKPLKIVANAGNGSAGPVIDLLSAHLPFEFVRICHEPDGNFSQRHPQPSAAGKSCRDGRCGCPAWRGYRTCLGRRF